MTKMYVAKPGIHLYEAANKLSGYKMQKRDYPQLNAVMGVPLTKEQMITIFGNVQSNLPGYGSRNGNPKSDYAYKHTAPRKFNHWKKLGLIVEV